MIIRGIALASILTIPSFAQSVADSASVKVLTATASAPTDSAKVHSATVSAPTDSAKVQSATASAPTTDSAKVQSATASAPTTDSAKVQSATAGAPTDSAKVQSATAGAPMDSAKVQSATASALIDSAKVQSASVDELIDSAKVQSATASAPEDTANVQSVPTNVQTETAWTVSGSWGAEFGYHSVVTQKNKMDSVYVNGTDSILPGKKYKNYFQVPGIYAAWNAFVQMESPTGKKFEFTLDASSDNWNRFDPKFVQVLYEDQRQKFILGDMFLAGGELYLDNLDVFGASYDLRLGQDSVVMLSVFGGENRAPK